MGLKASNSTDLTVTLEQEDSDVNIVINDITVAFFNDQGVLVLVDHDLITAKELGNHVSFEDFGGSYYVTVQSMDGNPFRLDEE